jgi:hypothetical protein
MWSRGQQTILDFFETCDLGLKTHTICVLCVSSTEIFVMKVATQTAAMSFPQAFLTSAFTGSKFCREIRERGPFENSRKRNFEIL